VLENGDRIYIRAFDKIHYLVALGGGGHDLLADITDPGKWGNLYDS